MSVACSREATLHVRDGTEHRGKILRYDGKYVLIEGDHGRVKAVKRSAIVDVDHPGMPTIIAGAAVIVVGALFAYRIASVPCDETRTANCGEQEHEDRVGAWVVFTLHAIPGSSLLLYGGLVRAASVDNYETVPDPSVVRAANRSPLPGLNLSGSF